MRTTNASVTRLLPPTHDRELVIRAREGEREAQELLFRRHVQMAQGVAIRLLGRDADVEDVVHEAFLKAFGRLHKLTRDEAFAPWLATIVTGTSIDTLRRRRLLAKLGLIGLAPIEIERLVARTAPADVVAELRAVYAIVDRLPTKERVVLVLRRIEQLKLEEIAARTGWSLATVKRTLVRAETALEAAMGPVGPGGTIDSSTGNDANDAKGQAR